MDIRATIEPKSDQLNYDDLIGATKTITVTAVTAGTRDQPVNVHYDGENGRPYKPCKSMRRLLVACWGDDGRDWVGKSMTLFGDPDVVFGGVKVGGIRISHVSDIERDLSIALTASKGKRKQYTVSKLDIKPADNSELINTIKTSIANCCKIAGIDKMIERIAQLVSDGKLAAGEAENLADLARKRRDALDFAGEDE